MAQKEIVFSGVQPSGNLTIGNWLGAISHWAENQHRYDNIFCVVDMHAITVPHDPALLAAKTREVAALYLACGISLEHAIIFVQSHVSAHAEGAWLLNCYTPTGWLFRMTQYKDKARKQEDRGVSVSTGLLDYPVLMAVDILLYQTNKVPVGDDQRQHIELTRDIAQRFNSLYGEVFTIPQGLYRASGARIMGLDDPTKKMSKSEAKWGPAVHQLDPPDEVRKKIMRAKTDSGREIIFSDDPAKAGVNNLLTIYQVITGQGREEIEAEFAGRGYGELKQATAEVVIEGLKPIQEEYRRLTEDVAYIDDILAQGAQKARERSAPTLQKMYAAVGMLPRQS